MKKAVNEPSTNSLQLDAAATQRGADCATAHGFPSSECPGPTHYAGCACHEKGWENKWKCAVEMAARATLERDEARRMWSIHQDRLAEASVLIAEIMRDEVNVVDECEKFLRAYAPHHLFPENADVDSQS